MQLATILQRLDAQERRLSNIGAGDFLPFDYRIHTPDGDVLVDFDEGRTEDAHLVNIVVIPRGKYLVASEEHYGEIVQEWRSRPTGETYWCMLDDGREARLTRHQVFLAPVLVDAPPEVETASVEVTDQPIATGGQDGSPPSVAAKDETAAQIARLEDLGFGKKAKDRDDDDPPSRKRFEWSYDDL